MGVIKGLFMAPFGAVGIVLFALVCGLVLFGPPFALWWLATQALALAEPWPGILLVLTIGCWVFGTFRALTIWQGRSQA